VQIIGEKGNEVLTRFGINANSKRLCHFLAQVSHECMGFTRVEEGLNYSAGRMLEVFGVGKHSARITPSEAQRLAGHQEAFAERVYGLGNPTMARSLGNTQPGDGYRYRGRGFMQITGRDAYQDASNRSGVDFVANPDIVVQPFYALMTAAAFWDKKNLNPYADQNNIEQLTKRINGAYNGLADRKSQFATAQRLWGGSATAAGRSLGPSSGSFGGERPRLEYGDLKPEVLEAKKLLVSSGYSGFVMDEVFSRSMHMAVVRFKLDHSLPGDGIIDEETWGVLEREAKVWGTRSITPEGAAKDDDEQSRRRGRAVQGWGRFLFVAAAAAIGARLLLDRGIVWPRSPWEWAALGFVALVIISSFALMAIGGAIIRAGRTRPVAADAIDDLGIRPGDDGAQTSLSWTRGMAPLEFNLVKGKRYKGKITLTGFETWASNSMVADKFRELGFTDVSISGSGSTRMGEGKWGKPDQSIPMPSQLSDVVEAA
jgi:putative chitinase